MAKAGQKILIVGPAWVGDIVMAQSLCIALAQEAEGTIIDVLAPSWSLPIVARMSEVRRGIEMPMGHGQLGLGLRWKLGRELKREGYDRAIILPRSLKAALVPAFAGIPTRTGFLGETRYGFINDIRPLDKDVLNQTVLRFSALGLPRGAPVPPPVHPPHLSVDVDAQAAARERLGLTGGRPIVGIMPGAEHGNAKQWPLDKYGQLAAQMEAQGYQVWIFGGPKDAPTGEEIASHAGEHTHNLCGKTSLVEVIDLIAACKAAVSNDSGLLHIAAAVGLPVVAIYGASSAAFTPPLTDRAIIVDLEMDCRPCFARVCPLGHTNCLNNIDVPRVAAALEQQLASA